MRLTPAGTELAVAEGVETALAFAQMFNAPTWAALSTAGLIAFMVPAGVKRLIVAADNDPDGLKAARALAERARAVCEVVITYPDAPGDWNDCLRDMPA